MKKRTLCQRCQCKSCKENRIWIDRIIAFKIETEKLKKKIKKIPNGKIKMNNEGKKRSISSLGMKVGGYVKK